MLFRQHLKTHVVKTTLRKEMLGWRQHPCGCHYLEGRGCWGRWGRGWEGKSALPALATCELMGQQAVVLGTQPSPVAGAVWSKGLLGVFVEKLG